MGEVYRATDSRLNRVVALKALHSLSYGGRVQVLEITDDTVLRVIQP